MLEPVGVSVAGGTERLRSPEGMLSIDMMRLSSVTVVEGRTKKDATKFSKSTAPAAEHRGLDASRGEQDDEGKKHGAKIGKMPRVG